MEKKTHKLSNPETKYRNPLADSKFRNKLCICGSGKKTKKCHGKNYIISKLEALELQGMANVKQ